MATLVLSTVGTALGGPVGSAIGALLGQSIDRQLLASPTKGPRVGDLAVQTSSYGTQVPRIYGRMRVAGSVIWATDLTEQENAGGAKGQPDASYAYTVSMAVALSARRVHSIGRIWADGKLIRGEAGDFKVGTKFRFHDGDEDQAIDPLIGSIEGIANTPAYRGLALALFEDLELREFGNRIPFLTFEIDADATELDVGGVLTDASAGAIQLNAPQRISGFAAYGSSIRSAIEPLIDCFALDVFDDGSALRSTDGRDVTPVSEEELGNSADGDPTPRFKREQRPASSAPASLQLTFYDPERDYQTGEARAMAGEHSGKETRRELPAAVNVGDAKSLAQHMLAREWINRDSLIVRLPPSMLELEPGSRLALPSAPAQWTVDKITIDGFVVVATLRPTISGAVAVPGSGGRIIASPDIPSGEISLVLLDFPDVSGVESNEPALLLAAGSESPAWKRRSVEVAFGEQRLSTETARSKAVLGYALNSLGGGTTDLVDAEGGVDIQLLDADQWLTSCDDEALSAGQNLASLGRELLQFGSAQSLGDGRFRLGRLVRGRGGTEWACAGHAAGDGFCLLERSALRPIPLPGWSIGAVVTATAGASSTSQMFSAEAVRPPSPVDLTAERQADGALLISWTRRSRQGFAWIDGVDAPLGEAREQYRIVLRGSAGSSEQTSTNPLLGLEAAVVTALGTGPLAIEVQQIGDLGVSRSAQLLINLD